jgi:hypothetical protein
MKKLNAKYYALKDITVYLDYKKTNNSFNDVYIFTPNQLRNRKTTYLNKLLGIKRF